MSVAALRPWAEFFGVLRRAGIAVSPLEARDAVRAAAAVGLERRADLQEALRAVLVRSRHDDPFFDAAFEGFFRADGTQQGDLFARLRSHGFSAVEIEALREVLDALEPSAGPASLTALLAAGDAELARLLHAGARRAGLARLRSEMQVGFFTVRLADEIGLTHATAGLGALRSRMKDALGSRGDRLVDLVAQHVEALRRATRHFVRTIAVQREEGPRARADERRFERISFADIATDRDEIRAMEREVRRLAERLRGRESVRRRRARRGPLDVRATLRRAHRTGGVPFAPIRRTQRRDRPKLALLCDVSDSVRASARFVLLFVHAAQSLFARTRSFVFVSELAEATATFRALPVDEAIARASSGDLVPVTQNSNYGHALSVFVSRYPDAVDRHTTVVILGDARSNFFPPCPERLAWVRTRAARVLWLNPEPRGAWGTGDSAMSTYLPSCSSAHVTSDLASLREAVDALVRASHR